MDVAYDPDTEPRVSCAPVPTRGLDYLLSAWSGAGDLVRAISAVKAEASDVADWKESDVQRRLRRIVFERAKAAIKMWPHRIADWVGALPTVSTTSRVRAAHPFRGADWVETYIRGGARPRDWFGKSRARADDSILVSSFKWTADRLLSVAAEQETLSRSIVAPVKAQLEAVGQLLSMEPLASAVPERPGSVELRAIAREGTPWSAVCAVARELLKMDGHPRELAYELLMPDSDCRWRLFHVGVLGECLLALADLGYALKSVRPIAAGLAGPVFSAALGPHQIDIWFEAGAAWSYQPYGNIPEPYKAASVGARGSFQPLGADIMLRAQGGRVLVIECKYGDAEYVCRNGYLQAVTYAVEALEFGGEVQAAVLGPEGVVSVGATKTRAGDLSILPPSALGWLMGQFTR